MSYPCIDDIKIVTWLRSLRKLGELEQCKGSRVTLLSTLMFRECREMKRELQEKWKEREEYKGKETEC